MKPDSEDLVGTSKFFFDKYSTYYMFYVGAYQIASSAMPGRGGTVRASRA